jgi:hypothetical protein
MKFWLLNYLIKKKFIFLHPINKIKHFIWKIEILSLLLNQKYNLQIAQQEADLYKTLSGYNKDFAKQTDKTFGDVVKSISQKIERS